MLDTIRQLIPPYQSYSQELKSTSAALLCSLGMERTCHGQAGPRKLLVEARGPQDPPQSDHGHFRWPCLDISLSDWVWPVALDKAANMPSSACRTSRSSLLGILYRQDGSQRQLRCTARPQNDL